VKKLEFLICGSPNDAFWSQLAMFRLSLNSLGSDFRSARLVLVVADLERVPLPDRWRPFFTDIEVRWAPVESYLDYGDGEGHLFTLIDPTADITFLCDADTLLINELPTDFLENIIRDPAICGVIAHIAPPKVDKFGHDYKNLANDEFWHQLSQHVLGREIVLPYQYTLRPQLGHCPFYINYGFVVGTPDLLMELHRNLSIVQPAIRKWLDNDFYGQLGIALGVESGNLPTRALPMRYNFPNDVRAEERYPEELTNVLVIHYLRRQIFDRQQIFSNEANFDAFMSIELAGSNAVFQRRVRDLTNAIYPF